MPPNRNRMQKARPTKAATRTPPARNDVPEQAPAKADDPVSVIAAALWGVMAAIGYVQKTGQNEFHGYSYASESDLLAVLRPEMIKQGLMLIPSGQRAGEIDQHGNLTVEVAYTLLHKSGARWPEPIIAFGAGNDKARGSGGVGDKGLYKALTGANKYLLFKLFQIATGDDPETADQGHEPGNLPPADDRRVDRGESRDEPQGGPDMMSRQEQSAFLEELKVRLDGAKTGEAITAEMLSERVQSGLRRITPNAQKKTRDYATTRFRELQKGKPEVKPEAKPETPADDPDADQLPD
jgi:hypothetical protein